MDEDRTTLEHWRAAFTLERWFLVARGWGEQVTPYAMEVDGQGVIAVFTTPERARDFALAAGLPEEEAGALLAVPVASCVAYLVQFADDGVEAVVLDPGVSDAAVVLAALPHLEQVAEAGADGDDGEPDLG